jgi:hypothetical protein
MGLRQSLAKKVAHLRTLEEVFDRSVSLAEARDPSADPDELAREIAEWVAVEARHELLKREIGSGWLDALEAEREREGSAELERELADLEPHLERELAELVHDWLLPA